VIWDDTIGFFLWKSLISVTFGADTKGSRFEGFVLSLSALTLFEVICERCLSGCKSLASVTFDAESKVSRLSDDESLVRGRFP
jgi:hypothetical protein